MAYTIIPSFAVGQLLTSDLMNDIKDDIDYFRTPPQYLYSRLTTDADYTRNNAAYADLDTTNILCNITTTGNPVLVSLVAGRITVATRAEFTLLVDGVDVVGGNSLIYAGQTNIPIHLQRIVSGLSAGVHEFKIQWKTTGGTATLFAVNGIQYFVREI